MEFEERFGIYIEEYDNAVAALLGEVLDDVEEADYIEALYEDLHWYMQAREMGLV